MDHEIQREKDIKKRQENLLERLTKRKEELEIDNVDDKSRRRKIRSRESRRRRQRELEEDIRESKREKDMEEVAKREKERKEAEETRMLEEDERKEREIKEERWRNYNMYNQTGSPKMGLEVNRDGPIQVSFAKTNKKFENMSPTGVFNDETDQNGGSLPRGKKAPKIEIQNNSKDIHSVIKTIPTKKEELYEYTIDWRAVKQHNIIYKAMLPWVKKLSFQILGEEEEAFVSFICKKLEEENSAPEMVSLLSPLLEDDAEEFVVRMWRMLICNIKIESNDT